MITWLWLDFETYYADDYTLRKLTPAEYILDPRFECICVATKVDNGPIVTIDGPDFPAWLAQFDAQNTVTVTFNALFDNCILAWHYGFVPKRMIDVLGMACTMLSHELPRLSLEKVAEHLRVGRKGTAIQLVKGMQSSAPVSRLPEMSKDASKKGLTLWRSQTTLSSQASAFACVRALRVPALAVQRAVIIQLFRKRRARQ